MSDAPVTPRSICGITFPRALHVLWFPYAPTWRTGGCVEEELKEIVREGCRAPVSPACRPGGPMAVSWPPSEVPCWERIERDVEDQESR